GGASRYDHVDKRHGRGLCCCGWMRRHHLRGDAWNPAEASTPLLTCWTRWTRGLAPAARGRCGDRRRVEKESSDRPDEWRIRVVLMGDSVLDNFFWLQTPTRHLRVQLQEQLAKSRNAKVKQLQCVNLAVDQMTTFDFVERKPQENPWETYAKARKLVAFEDDEDKEYVVDSDGVIRSVENLRRLEDVKWVVLSLGGNDDVYLNAEVKGKLLSSLLPNAEGKRKEVGQ
ncbi:Uncharacterized protein SCF082_LOCUS46827, partial [Durusdinium trenchii]